MSYDPHPGESCSLMKEIDSKPGHCKRVWRGRNAKVTRSIRKLAEATGLLA